MLTRRFFLTNSAIGLATWLGAPRFVTVSAAAQAFPVAHTDAEWGVLLTPDQYAVLRQSATERPFTSPLLNEHRAGVFACAGCDLGLFSSETKFESGTGWPSFWAPIAEENISTAEDHTLKTPRIAVSCRRCDAHLGHVFKDGPEPTGLRYCLNSASLNFVKSSEKPAI